MVSKNNSHHQKLMRTAIRFAQKGQGLTAPNPSVGCVISNREGYILAGASTAQNGRPHAETIALQQANAKEVEGGNAYVTLEPCSHYGQTGPCSQKLIKSGIRRCYVGIKDPDPRVNGQGIAQLKAAGIEVMVETLEKDLCQWIMRSHLLRIQQKRPSFALKVACSLDGMIALGNNISQWITDVDTRSFGHLLRSNNDAILIGIETALQDNPSLDCRLDGYKHDGQKIIVLDSTLRLPPSAKLMAHSPIIYTSTDANNAHEEMLEKGGATIVKVKKSKKNKLCLASICNDLTKRGVHHVLVEGGSKIAASFIEEQIIDELYLLRSPRIIGGDGISFTGALGIDQLIKTPKFKIHERRTLTPDVIEVWHNNPFK